MGTHGVILATAMAVSGTVVLLVLCRQRPMSPAVDRGTGAPPTSSLRPCLSDSTKSEGKAKKKKKKRVHFAEEVVELPAEGCNTYQEDKQLEEEEDDGRVEAAAPPEAPRVRHGWTECGRQVRGGMPANRVALYSGILRDRHHRMACSY